MGRGPRRAKPALSRIIHGRALARRASQGAVTSFVSLVCAPGSVAHFCAGRPWRCIIRARLCTCRRTRKFPTADRCETRVGPAGRICCRAGLSAGQQASRGVGDRNDRVIAAIRSPVRVPCRRLADGAEERLHERVLSLAHPAFPSAGKVVPPRMISGEEPRRRYRAETCGVARSRTTVDLPLLILFST
jgi:hypothetical protein